MKTEDWFDFGYLAILVIIEGLIWWYTGFSSLILTYGFICALRGTQISRMRNEGTWKRLRMSRRE